MKLRKRKLKQIILDILSLFEVERNDMFNPLYIQAVHHFASGRAKPNPAVFINRRFWCVLSVCNLHFC